MTAKPATPKKLLSDSLSDHTLDHPASKRLTIGDTIYDLADHTPMMVQYLTMKANYPQALLLYRMGDFYELFFEDAKRAAQILDITLTRRGTDKAGHTIAMAGVPFHAADSYMARLIAAGQTVVVCEQIDESAPSQLLLWVLKVTNSSRNTLIKIALQTQRTQPINLLVSCVVR